jgi:hypothetical protein
MNGALSEGLLPGILRELYVDRKTGVLSFVRGDQRRALHFRKGHIVRGESNVKQEHLGETLVRNGLLSEEGLSRATAVVLNEGKRLGMALRELGLFEGQALEDALALQVREIINNAFSWGDGSYAFEPAVESNTRQDAEVTLKLSPGELILEAVRRVQDPDVVRYALGDLGRILAHSSDPLLRFQRINLTPSDGFILSRIDGTLSAREIILLSPTDAEDTERSLFGLLCTGVVEFLALPPKPAPPPEPRRAVATAAAPQPAAPLPPASPDQVEALKARETRRQEILEAYEGLKTRNHFEVLGIPRASNDVQVKEAYFRLARRFHPDTHHDAILADMHDKIEAIFIRLGEAYEILRDRNRRASYESDLASRTPRSPLSAPNQPPAADPELEARVAEESVKRAEDYLAEGKYWDAIQLLEPAVNALSGKWKTRGRLALARGYLKNPHWLKRAEDVLQTIVREDARSADAFYLLGALYKQGGLPSRAASMFRKALEAKPDHEQAAAELAGLPAPAEAAVPPAEGGSILKKLFGRS